MYYVSNWQPAVVVTIALVALKATMSRIITNMLMCLSTSSTKMLNK